MGDPALSMSYVPNILWGSVDLARPAKERRVRLKVAKRSAFDVWSSAETTIEWVVPVLEQINAIGELEDGWAGPDSRQIADPAIQQALGILSDTMARDTVPPQVVPTAEGGLQMEWHYSGVDLEVYVEPDGHTSAWCREGSREWEEDFFARARLTKELSLLTRTYCA
jgi:hypothetical protein